MKRTIIGDYLSMNHATPVRVFGCDGVLYVDHATDSNAPEVGYNENILLDFAGAYYPLQLLGFIEKHGTLFNIDKQGAIELPEGAATIAPTEESLRAALALLGYPDGKKRKVTQDLKRIHRDCIERDTGFLWFANQREYFGDWIAARAVFQVALQLLRGDSICGRKDSCPDFAVNLENAPRYRAFLETATIGHHWTMTTHGLEPISEKRGVFVEDGLLKYHCPGETVEQAVSRLISVHTSNAVKTPCIGLELVEQYTNLLQVIWCQLPEQLGRRVVVERCENPRCNNVMLKLYGDEKHACCDSCQQTLKEGRG